MRKPVISSQLSRELFKFQEVGRHAVFTAVRGLNAVEQGASGGGIIRSGSAQHLYELGTAAIYPASLDCPVIAQF
jgi:methylmalonyl-CoA mutase cobalamin-binding subunit